MLICLRKAKICSLFFFWESKDMDIYRISLRYTNPTTFNTNLVIFPIYIRRILLCAFVIHFYLGLHSLFVCLHTKMRCIASNKGRRIWYTKVKNKEANYLWHSFLHDCHLFIYFFVFVFDKMTTWYLLDLLDLSDSYKISFFSFFCSSLIYLLFIFLFLSSFYIYSN